MLKNCSLDIQHERIIDYFLIHLYSRNIIKTIQWVFFKFNRNKQKLKISQVLITSKGMFKEQK